MQSGKILLLLTRDKAGGSSSGNRSNTSTYMYSKRICCINFPSSNTSSARLLLKVPCKLLVVYNCSTCTYSENGDQTMCQVVAYKRLKAMKNYNAITSKSGRGRVRVQEVLTIGIWIGKIWCFRYVGGWLWEVVAHGGSTVIVLKWKTRDCCCGTPVQTVHCQ